MCQQISSCGLGLAETYVETDGTRSVGVTTARTVAKITTLSLYMTVRREGALHEARSREDEEK